MHTNLLFNSNGAAVDSMLAATMPGFNEITLLSARRICLCFSSRSFASRMRSASLCFPRSIFSKPSLQTHAFVINRIRTRSDFNIGKFTIRFWIVAQFLMTDVIYLIHAGNVLRCAASRVVGIKSTLSN